MTVAEPTSRPQDRSSRIRPFAWMRRLAHRRSSTTDKVRNNNKNTSNFGPSEAKKLKISSFESSQPLGTDANFPAYLKQEHRQADSIDSDHDAAHGRDQAESYRSVAPTVTTNPETILSDGDRQSKAGTSGTVGGGMSTASGGANSIFSSPNHSTHSLTTTLTTIQSQATSTGPGRNPTSTQQTPVLPQSSTYFSHQYPTAPVSALPAHLNPHPSHMPTTYRSATANDLLTDNASIITLASSSHRRQRRNSLDTDASIRAIRPSSNWGGSRESLPLSMLSQNIDFGGPVHPLSQTQPRPVAREERASVGAPMLSSERNSIYGKSSTGGADAVNGREGSVRSEPQGHMRNDSSTGSAGGYSTTWPGMQENVVQDVVGGQS